jgi:hypothetical protein
MVGKVLRDGEPFADGTDDTGDIPIADDDTAVAPTGAPSLLVMFLMLLLFHVVVRLLLA